jgi:hypothetical protein
LDLANDATITLGAGQIQTGLFGSSQSFGVFSTGPNAKVILSGTQIITSGMGCFGLVAVNGATIDASKSGDISTSSDFSTAVFANASKITLGAAQIMTTGSQSFGVFSTGSKAAASTSTWRSTTCYSAGAPFAHQ